MNIRKEIVVPAPIQWGGSLEDFMCMQKYEGDDDEGLYALCCNELDWEEQAELARKIANLPERQDVQYG